MFHLRGVVAATFLVAAIAPALADGELPNLITDHDQKRLDEYQATLDEAARDARQGGSKDDVETFDEVIAREPRSFQGFDMTGDWQCRTIKAGGPAPLVIYDWFDCRVTDDGSGWMLEKLSGSQRTKGRFYTESDTRLVYLGAYYVAGDTAPDYGAGPETDMVGYALRSGDERWRIMFPAPARESKLDILELKR